jgi:hypothetical protein
MDTKGRAPSQNVVDVTDKPSQWRFGKPDDFLKHRTWVYDPVAGRYIDSTLLPPAVAENYGGGKGSGVSPTDFAKALKSIGIIWGLK